MPTLYCSLLHAAALGLAFQVVLDLFGVSDGIGQVELVGKGVVLKLQSNYVSLVFSHNTLKNYFFLMQVFDLGLKSPDQYIFFIDGARVSGFMKFDPVTLFGLVHELLLEPLNLLLVVWDTLLAVNKDTIIFEVLHGLAYWSAGMVLFE